MTKRMRGMTKLTSTLEPTMRRKSITLAKNNMNFSNFNDMAQFFDDVDEILYGKRPRGTKRIQAVDENATTRELTLSEQIGMPIRIQKDA